MELIVISKETYFESEGKVINELFDSGIKIFHLRKPQSDLVSYVKLINEIDPSFHQQLSLHQFHELRSQFDITRLHYPEMERVAGLRSTAYINSTSIHNLKELEDLTQYDYAFFGPVFNSLSKPGYQGIVDQGFKLPPSPLKVIALGGINIENVEKVSEMGFDGLALLGAIWGDTKSAIKNFKKIKEICQDLM